MPEHYMTPDSEILENEELSEQELLDLAILESDAEKLQPIVPEKPSTQTYKEEKRMK